MSMISEQVKELREIANEWNQDNQINPVSRVLNKSADTIETLSAKLQAANMERSTDDCGNKWIDKDLLMESLIPILNENGDMYLAGRIIGLIDTQAEMR